jgi:hypothetical protein
MTGEELEKAITFIVNQQAQFASDIQKLQESQAQTDAVVARLAQATVTGFNELRDSVAAVATAQIKSEDKIAALADAQARTDRQLAETSERMNALIDTVERIISERRNGKS